MKKSILDIKIDDVSIDQAANIVESWLFKPGKHYIVTPNPEIVVMAQKDQELKSIINKADLAIPDGIGLKLFSDIVCYTPGVDLMEKLILMAEENGFTVGLLGGKMGVAEKAAKRLKVKYPNLKISFATGDVEIDEEGLEIESRNHDSLFMIHNCDILFVGFGPPKQEKWISKNLSKLPVKVVMGVGGSFDYISGKVLRAPKLIRMIGFEWLFRLILQPWRFKRQLALVKYIWLLTNR